MRRTGQIEAKTGDYIESFTSEEAVLEATGALETLARKAGLRRELVYCLVPGKWGERGGTWQVYLLP